MSNFGVSINTYINKNQELLKDHNSTLEFAKETANDYSAKFGIIEKGLIGIFDQIQTGLKDYQVTTKGNLNEYLGEFTTTLTNAHQGLESAVNGLSEISEELVDQIDKLVTVR